MIHTSNHNDDRSTHITVLLHEAVDMLDLASGSVVFEGTLGNGGHSLRICERIGIKGKLIATDLDQKALDTARYILESESCRAETFLYKKNFRALDQALSESGVREGEVNAALFDLGLRTEQLFESGRGFSFNEPEEPLYMTFSSTPSEQITAQDVLNNWDESLLAQIIYVFGDERKAKKIARYIVERRDKKPFEIVQDLLEVIDSACGPHRHGKAHPATRTFQALRMAVNDEYGALEEALQKIHQFMAPQGRVAIISFHSGEDRIVKHFIRARVNEGSAEHITKKPIVPTIEEIKKNPRSRSAKLRVWKKITTNSDFI
jgi:16S rRNA (cytosine1402-N4)-methyltransferase